MSFSIASLFRRMLDWKPDAVLASWGYPDAPAVKQLLGNADLPLFCSVHGSDVHLHCLVPSRRRQVVKTFNSADTVFTVSGELRSRLIDHGVEPGRLIVNYVGVDDTKFHPIEKRVARRALALPTDRNIFLYVGNIKVPKGPFDLLAAFERLAQRSQLDNTTIIYIGDGEGRRHLTQLGEELQAKHPGCQVMVCGALPHEQLNTWMNAADFVCLPSHSEGVPNVILEAMRCGTPVIASSVGGIPEVLDSKCGVLVPAKDIEAIADGIDQARRTTWDQAEIRRHSQSFQWGRHAEFIHQLVSRATDKNRRNSRSINSASEIPNEEFWQNASTPKLSN